MQIEAFEGVAVSASVSNNDFSFDSPVGIGIDIEGLDGSNIASNNFSGEAGSAIIVDDGGIGTTVVSNDMFGFFADDDEILLGDDSTRTLPPIIHFAFINDQGVTNVVIYRVSRLKQLYNFDAVCTPRRCRATFLGRQQLGLSIPPGRDSVQSESGEPRFIASGSTFTLSQSGVCRALIGTGKRGKIRDLWKTYFRVQKTQLIKGWL